jgi:hypothetical protein
VNALSFRTRRSLKSVEPECSRVYKFVYNRAFVHGGQTESSTIELKLIEIRIEARRHRTARDNS